MTSHIGIARPYYEGFISALLKSSDEAVRSLENLMFAENRCGRKTSDII